MAITSADIIAALIAVEKLIELINALVAGQADNMTPADRARVTQQTEMLKLRAEQVLTEIKGQA